MTILGVDLSSNNAVFDFDLAHQQGVRAAYIKLGGDNVARLGRYVSGIYPARIDAARAHGWAVGHYWLTGGHDPEAAAAFFVRNLRNPQPGDFFVLDNESLDDGNMYSDDEAARWIRTVQGLVGGSPRRVFMYASGSPMKGSSWAGVRATGAQCLVAWYDIGPWGFPQPLGSWPAEQIGGHQFTSSATLGNGAAIDANVFKDNAFTATAAASVPKPQMQEDVMAIIQVTDVKPNPVYLVAPEFIAHIPNPVALAVAKANFATFDGVHNVSTVEFNATLAMLRIPQNQAYHFGGHQAGYSWSQNAETAAQLAAVEKKIGV